MLELTPREYQLLDEALESFIQDHDAYLDQLDSMAYDGLYVDRWTYEDTFAVINEAENLQDMLLDEYYALLDDEFEDDWYDDEVEYLWDIEIDELDAIDEWELDDVPV